jgi:hypothetical protein
LADQIVPNPDPAQTPFERIRQFDEDDQEFWSARDLMPILEYVSWQKFKNVLIKGQIACENSGYDPGDHFIQAVKMVAIGSDAKREVNPLHLDRRWHRVLTHFVRRSFALLGAWATAG